MSHYLLGNVQERVMVRPHPAMCLQRSPTVSMLPASSRGAKRQAIRRVRAAPEEPKPELETPISEIEPRLPSPPRTIGDRLERYRSGSLITENLARKTVENEFYSSNWDGDVYTGSNWNILTVLLLVSFATPLVGLVFAYFTYGWLWGLGTQAI